jgi:hypothetical protein
MIFYFTRCYKRKLSTFFIINKANKKIFNSKAVKFSIYQHFISLTVTQSNVISVANEREILITNIFNFMLPQFYIIRTLFIHLSTMNNITFLCLWCFIIKILIKNDWEFITFQINRILGSFIIIIIIHLNLSSIQGYHSPKTSQGSFCIWTLTISFLY